MNIFHAISLISGHLITIPYSYHTDYASEVFDLFQANNSRTLFIETSMSSAFHYIFFFFEIPLVRLVESGYLVARPQTPLADILTLKIGKGFGLYRVLGGRGSLNNQ